jgi:hypothetical protein
MAEYLMINPLMAGIAGGIIGAIMILWTTINGIRGKSKAYKILESTIWKSYGYRATWGGALLGTILGFIYGFLIWGIFSLIYNVLL